MNEAIPNPAELVARCNDEGIDLLSEIRTLDCSKEIAFAALRTSVFEGTLTKAEIFYAFGSIATEFEAAISQLTKAHAGIFVTNAILEEALKTSQLVLPFDADDFRFYLQCRDCFSDFQVLASNIERHLWHGTSITLLQNWGQNWIVEIDKNKRRLWSQVREDFRVDQNETPLFEFCSIPDLRDIITSTKHWLHFAKHLPAAFPDRASISDALNKLILTRNKIFHPTRRLGPSFTEFTNLQSLLAEINISRWRQLNVTYLPKLLGSGPEPKWY